jgi:hypothetical protein
LIIASNAERSESLFWEQLKSWRISSVDDAVGSISDFHRVRTRVQAAESFDEMLSSSELAVANVVISDH